MVKIGLSWKLFVVLLLNAAVFIRVMVAAVHLSVFINFEVYVREFALLRSSIHQSSALETTW
jgi:hypothetical protein